ncbi:uncharacterized protein L201_003006 [Kwoniella dendrophila CBS 6074]|uniref:Uncharacterized protein n=1 Tax=Kwoniella dendrophila CBS 6074 TaxID=1295534 RepID=A0AAX4JRL8_9TREE
MTNGSSNSTTATTSFSEITKSDREIYLKTMHKLLSRTSEGSTICPSQIPRKLHEENSQDYPNWRELMDPVRQVIWEQVNLGIVNITQKGEIRNYDERFQIKGPIRIKKGENWNENLIENPE